MPISTRPRWGKDYADPSTFIDPLFNTILPSGNTNYSLVGLTPAVAKKLKITGDINNVPSIAAEAKRCASTVGDVRPACYAALDRKLTTQIVPWVPYLWRDQVNILAPNVTKWTFDQNAGTVRLRARGDEQLEERREPGRARSPTSAPGPPDADMAFYITRRLAWTAVVVLVVLMLTFAVFYLMPAGDPALRFAGKSPTEQSLELVRERLGLDQPGTRSSPSTRRTSWPGTSTGGPASGTRT